VWKKKKKGGKSFAYHKKKRAIAFTENPAEKKEIETGSKTGKLNGGRT